MWYRSRSSLESWSDLARLVVQAVVMKRMRMGVLQKQTQQECSKGCLVALGPHWRKLSRNLLVEVVGACWALAVRWRMEDEAKDYLEKRMVALEWVRRR